MMICREIYRMCFCFNLQGAKDWNCEYCKGMYKYIVARFGYYVLATSCGLPIWVNLKSQILGESYESFDGPLVFALVCQTPPRISLWQRNLDGFLGYPFGCLLLGYWMAGVMQFVTSSFRKNLAWFQKKSLSCKWFLSFALERILFDSVWCLRYCNLDFLQHYKLKVKCMFCIILPQMSFICRVWLWLESRSAVLNAEVRRSSGVATLLAS